MPQKGKRMGGVAYVSLECFPVWFARAQLKTLHLECVKFLLQASFSD